VTILFVKQPSSVSQPPFGGLSGNVCDSSVARWKARSRVVTGNNGIFFVSFYTAEAIRANMRRNRPLLKEVGHFEAINIRLKGYVYRQHLYTVR